MATLEEIFNEKLTENGDYSFKSTLNDLVDILFMTEYYQKHLDMVKIGNSDKEKLFSMFIRDPRYGLGKRDLGRELMQQSGVNESDTVKAGRWDDLFYKIDELNEASFKLLSETLYREIKSGNELLKKWMPRYSSKNLMLARRFAKAFGMNKQEYGHFIKCNTVENKLSRKNTDEINFEHVPSLAMIKYYTRFITKDDTKVRFAKYLEDVKSGEKKLNVSTTNVYDIYKNRNVIDPDVFFEQLPKISISCIPVIDSSGSMNDQNDSYGKAMAVGHYLSKCSSYANGKVVSFSSKPQLLELGKENIIKREYTWNWDDNDKEYRQDLSNAKSKYEREILSMYTGDISNTDFGAVCNLLGKLDKDNAPDWIVVLSDMEFDMGSMNSKDEMMDIFKRCGMENTHIIWWNFNSRNRTCPETDSYGNIFISGYNPMLLKYLEVGFDSQKFLDVLLEEYKKNIGK